MIKDVNVSSIGGQQDTLCDCHRDPRTFPRTTYENRYTKRATPYGEINLIFMQNYENNIRVGVDFPPFSSFAPTSRRCRVAECSDKNRENAFEGDLNATLWEILPQLNATHAFINLGWHRLFNFDAQSNFTCTMGEYIEANPGIKLYHISHPPVTSEIPDPSTTFDGSKLKCDVDVLDRTILSKGVPKTW